MKKTIFQINLLLGTMLLASCAALGIGGFGNLGVGTVTSGTVDRQFYVQLIECVGNTSAQSVTAIMAVTNNGPNAYRYIGGSLNGSVAIDSNGYTSKPYNSAGKQYDLPSGVTVRVEIDRIEPVAPGTPSFQSLTISLGSGQNGSVMFRNVPIVWQ